jgi:hypothetical protein
MSSPAYDPDFAARAAALAARAQAPPPTSWRPEEGHPNPIAGVLLRVEDNHTVYGPCQIAVLRDPRDHEWSVWLLHSVLRNEFAKCSPQIGDLVAVTYEGKRPMKNPAPPPAPSHYEAYRVVVEHASTQPRVAWSGGPTETSPAFTQAEPVVQVVPEPAPASCATCGWLDGNHAPGCPVAASDDIPF